MGAKAVPTTRGHRGDGVAIGTAPSWGEGGPIVVCGDRRCKPLPEGMHAGYLACWEIGPSHRLFARMRNHFKAETIR
jgi:hypothetical protein